jgi:hypothetical protein
LFSESNTYFSAYSLCTSVHRRHRSGGFIIPLSKKIVAVCPVVAQNFNFTVGSKSFSSYGLFEWTEQVKIALRQVRTVGGLWQYLPMHFLQCSCCHSGDVLSRFVVEERDAFD